VHFLSSGFESPTGDSLGIEDVETMYGRVPNGRRIGRKMWRETCGGIIRTCEKKCGVGECPNAGNSVQTPRREENSYIPYSLKKKCIMKALG